MFLHVFLFCHRLYTLLSQAVELQKNKCPFHNTTQEEGIDNFNLLVDHYCSKYEIFVFIA